MAEFSKHQSEDWCHLCGKRRTDCVDVSYSSNAERSPLGRDKYLRMCGDCLHVAFIIVKSEWQESTGVRISETVDV